MKQLIKGKCKEDFDKWYKEVYQKESEYFFSLEGFEQAPLSMQYGVIVDFADSVGIHLHDYFDRWDRKYYWRIVGQDDIANNTDIEPFNIRPEARKAAIEKFVELYNKG